MTLGFSLLSIIAMPLQGGHLVLLPLHPMLFSLKTKQNKIKKSYWQMFGRTSEALATYEAIGASDGFRLGHWVPTSCLALLFCLSQVPMVSSCLSAAFQTLSLLMWQGYPVFGHWFQPIPSCLMDWTLNLILWPRPSIPPGCLLTLHMHI
jgi:hypothetical protein